MSCEIHTNYEEPTCPQCFDSLMVDYQCAREYARDLATLCALDERARIVAWLREGMRSVDPCYDDAGDVLADAIERGEHLKREK